MATLEEIGEALQKADAAGNTEDARQLANAYRQKQGMQGQEESQQTGTQPDLTPEQLQQLPDSPQGIYAAIPRNMLAHVNHDWVLRQYGIKKALEHPALIGAGQEVNTLYNFFTGKTPTPDQQAVAQALSKTHPVWAWIGGALADIAALIPLEVLTEGAATVALPEVATRSALGRILGGVGLGSAEGAGLSEAHKEDPLAGSLTGAFLGGLFPAAVEAIGGVRRLRQATTSPLPAETQPTLEAAQKADFPVYTSDVHTPTTFVGKQVQSFGRNIPFLGTGEGLVKRQAQRKELVSDLMDEFGQGEDLEGVKQDLTTKTNKIFKTASQQRKRLVEPIAYSPVNTEAVTNAIDNEIDRLTYQHSGEPYSRPDVSKIKTFEELKQDVQKADFKSLMDLRTRFNQQTHPVYGELKDLDNTAKTQIGGSIRNAIHDNAKQLMEPNDYRKFQQTEETLSDTLQSLKQGRIRKFLNKSALEKISPEQVERQILSKDSYTRKQIYNGLSSEGRSNARAMILNKLHRNATVTDELGNEVISPNRFLAQLDGYKNQIDSFFTAPQKARIEGLKRLLRVSKQSEIAKTLVPTGLQNLTAMIGGGVATTAYVLGLAKTAGMGALGIGVAHAYESAPVRNLLLKLGKLPPKSPEFNPTVQRIMNELSKATIAGETQARGNENATQ